MLGMRQQASGCWRFNSSLTQATSIPFPAFQGIFARGSQEEQRPPREQQGDRSKQAGKAWYSRAQACRSKTQTLDIENKDARLGMYACMHAYISYLYVYIYIYIYNTHIGMRVPTWM